METQTFQLLRFLAYSIIIYIGIFIIISLIGLSINKIDINTIKLKDNLDVLSDLTSTLLILSFKIYLSLIIPTLLVSKIYDPISNFFIKLKTK